MTFRESIETQIRTATERLILVSPSEQTGYLTQIAKLAGTLAKEKRAPHHTGSGVVTSEFQGAARVKALLGNQGQPQSSSRCQARY